MRLLYAANARLPTEKAHGVQIMKMCEAFAQNGAQVELVAPFRVQSAKMRRVHDLWAYYGVHKRFKLTRLPSLDLMFLDRYLPGKLFYLPFYVQMLTFSVCAVLYSLLRGMDILYSRYWVFFLLWLPWRWLKRQSLVLEEHTFPHGGGWGARLHLAVSRRVDRLVVITHQLRERYIAAGVPAGRVLVAADGVDLSLFEGLPCKEECRRRLGLPLDRPIIGYIGRFRTMEMEKGIPELIEAQADLSAFNGREPLLLCVGGPMDAVPGYLELAHHLGIPQRWLRFVDHVPNVEVPLWMRACDVVTIPWPWTEFSAYFTSPLKLFEYMASGTPIVATDLPSMREVLCDGENAVLVEPDDPKALAKGVKRVLDDPDLARRISEEAYSEVGQYSWDERAKKILAFVNQSLSERL